MKRVFQLLLLIAAVSLASFSPEKAQAYSCDECIEGCIQGYCGPIPDPQCADEVWLDCERACCG